MKLGGGFNNNAVNNSSNYKSQNDISSKSDYVGKNAPQIQARPTKDNLEAKHEKIKKQTKNVAKILTTFATMVSATALCIVGVDSLSASTITPTTFIAEATETEIYYYAELESFNNEDDVYVVLYNDFTNRSVKVNDIEAYGIFDHLQTNMVYTLALKQGSTIITSKKLRTVYNEELQKDYTERDDFDTGQPKTDDKQIEDITPIEELDESSREQEKPITADDDSGQTEPIIADDVEADVYEDDEDQPIEGDYNPEEGDYNPEEDESGNSADDPNNPNGQSNNNNDNKTGPNDDPTNNNEGEETNG